MLKQVSKETFDNLQNGYSVLVAIDDDYTASSRCMVSIYKDCAWVYSFMPKNNKQKTLRRALRKIKKIEEGW